MAMQASRPNLVRFSMYVWLTIAMFAVVVVCFAVYVGAEKRIDRANDVRFQTLALSEELRRSSDDLTRMVRVYVATGNPVYKQYYQEILSIRDGKTPRPIDYQNVYWDLVTPDNQRPRPMGAPISFLRLLQEAGCTQAEFAKLARAKANSDALTRIEFAAMALLEASKPVSEADRARALDMLTNAAYQQAKAGIMRPISEFNSMVAQRTLQAVRDEEANATRMRILLIAIGTIPMVLIWRVRGSLLAILGGSVSEVYKSIELIGRGDFTRTIPVERGMSDSVLGWLSATQENLALLNTQRKLAEDALRQSEQRFNRALDEMMEGCMLLGFDWTILYINQAGAQHAQKQRADLMGRKLTDVFPGIEQSDVYALYRQVMDERIQRRQEVSFHFPDGSVRWFDLAVTPTMEGISALGLDITERRQLAQRREMMTSQLEQLVAQRTAELQDLLDVVRKSSAAKSTFLSGMSHELRTPMNAILGFSQLLLMQDLPDRQKGMILEIQRAGHHLLALIDDLLDLTRVESGKVSLSITSVRLSDVVGDALSMARYHIDRMRIEVENHCASEICVQADPVRLRQVLVNLLTNAAKYNREQGRITIDTTTTEQQGLRLAISDTGHGIQSEQIPLLFRSFERLGAERSGIQGTGIGLAMSKQLTELMGGKIGVTSQPGVGSTFWLELPLAHRDLHEDAGATPSVDESNLPMHPLQVLYIEDSPANLNVVNGLFALRPCWHLYTAETGSAGLDIAKSRALDVILLDIHLPGMDGYEVLQALRSDKATQSIPVIALSADAMPEQVERGLQAGFHAYLPKPLDLPHLMNVLDALAVHH
ncbi:PAS domain-containing hybrid sensor histidine kinase/response regulator [Aquabacterium sp.]|uniref:PAS domain-containing hybrid sensor histidine kinase/response regulator n=1 Tax=Aquabacterium sp. TaxID=1872578 RepID=UPI002E30FB5D|nr:ATP-binding protein [Aquabacterium sp.]HEX5312540.1 ATP-binding protein [Aquabacterium sp.]